MWVTIVLFTLCGAPHGLMRLTVDIPSQQVQVDVVGGEDMQKRLNLVGRMGITPPTYELSESLGVTCS